jgi:hypothetical protein
VSASVSGPEPRDGSPHASTRRLVGAFAIVTTLLLASFAASPAWAQDAGGATSPDPPGAADAPPPVPPAPTAPTSSSGSAPAVPSPPAVPDVPPVEQHTGAGASGPASGDTASQGGSKPPHGGGNRGSYVYSTDGLTTTISVPAKSADPGKKPPVSPAAHANPGSLRAVDKPGRSDGHGSAARSRRANAKISPLGGPPGFGNQLPSRNPSVSLLTDTGGVAGLALAGMLAVLGAAVVLRRDRSSIFCMPTVTWRPLAYVPPIELPG